jgi:hypothetical protein
MFTDILQLIDDLIQNTGLPYLESGSHLLAHVLKTGLAVFGTIRRW